MNSSLIFLRAQVYNFPLFHNKKQQMLFCFISFFFFCFAQRGFSTSYNFSVDNSVNHSTSLYSYFHTAYQSYSTANSSDEFHFQIVPTAFPYIINQNEIISGPIFDQVTGNLSNYKSFY